MTHTTLEGSFTGLSLFAGIGSTARALSTILGGDVVGAVDNMPEACETLRLNGFKAFCADVRELDFRRFGRVDVLTGGPPCQPFSAAANNDGRFDPRDMIPEFIRAIAETLPRVFLMEEVQTLTWKKHRAYFEHVLSCIEALGYNVTWKIINTADHGVPQARKRLFVVGRRADLEPPRLPDIKRRHVPMGEALGWTAQTCFLRNQKAPEPARCNLRQYEYLWPLSRPSTTVVGSFRPDVQAAPGYRQKGDGPRQNALGSVVTTELERLLLQGLPPDWKLSDRKRDLQIGNSCPSIVVADLLSVNL